MEKSLIGTFPARNWSFPILPISRLPWARQKKKLLFPKMWMTKKILTRAAANLFLNIVNKVD